MRGLFFRARRHGGSGLGDNLTGVLLGEGLELFVSFNGLPHSWNLLAWDIASHVFAIFTCLELEEGTGGGFLDDGELATFHELDMGNLLKDEWQRIGLVHGEKYLHW